MVSIPSILQQIVDSAVEAVADVRIAEKVADPRSLEDAVRRTRPDVLLLGLGPLDDVADYSEVLYEHPRLRMIGVSPDGSDVQACELAPTTSRFGNVSPEELIGLIRHSNDARGR